MGHGILAAFDGPGRAIRCAMSIGDAAVRRRAGRARRAAHRRMRGGRLRRTRSRRGRRQPDRRVGQRPVRSWCPARCATWCPVRASCSATVSCSTSREQAGPRGVFPVLGHGAPPETVRRLAIDQANVLRRDGEYWTAAYGGLVVTLRDSKGLRDLARLLAAPRHELHVLDLATPAAAARTAPSIREALDAGLSMRLPLHRAGHRRRRAGGVPTSDRRAETGHRRRGDRRRRRGRGKGPTGARHPRQGTRLRLRPRRPAPPHARSRRARPQGGHPTHPRCRRPHRPRPPSTRTAPPRLGAHRRLLQLRTGARPRLGRRWSDQTALTPRSDILAVPRRRAAIRRAWSRRTGSG